MKYLEHFMALFGDLTVADVVTAIIAGLFLYFAYKKFSNYLVARNKAEEEKNANINEALTAVRKYPEYRQQSIKIQNLLESEIQELRSQLSATVERLCTIEEKSAKREQNKLRDLLLQNFRYYTNPDTNPSGSWSRMEAEAFWELFQDYEDCGGNGYMHSYVRPAMERLTVVEVGIHHAEH